jgi:hypothetical protein
MHTSAVEKPTSIRSSGARNESRCTRDRTSVVPSTGFSIREGGMEMVAIMEVRRKTAKRTTSVSRILAMSLYLRKYLRRVMRAARWEDEERAQT